jgi:hypothetical protein
MEGRAGRTAAAALVAAWSRRKRRERETGKKNKVQKAPYEFLEAMPTST